MILIDSHVLIWSMFNDEKIGSNSHRLLSDSSVDVYVSVVSLWELEIKHINGLLAYSSEDFSKGVDDVGFQILDLKIDHIKEYKNIDLLHKDPFDRMLCSIARSENTSLMTADSKILNSDYKTLNCRA